MSGLSSGDSNRIRSNVKVLSEVDEVKVTNCLSDRHDSRSICTDGRCVDRDLCGQVGLSSDSVHSPHLSINLILDAVHGLSNGLRVGADSPHAGRDARAHSLLGGGHF